MRYALAGLLLLAQAAAACPDRPLRAVRIGVTFADSPHVDVVERHRKEIFSRVNEYLRQASIDVEFVDGPAEHRIVFRERNRLIDIIAARGNVTAVTYPWRRISYINAFPAFAKHEQDQPELFREQYVNIMLHEIGHQYGLYHRTDPFNLMYGGPITSRPKLTCRQQEFLYSRSGQ